MPLIKIRFYLLIRRIIHLYTISTFPDDDGFGNRNINQNDDSNFRPLDFPSEPDNFVVTDDDQNYRYRSIPFYWFKDSQINKC